MDRSAVVTEAPGLRDAVMRARDAARHDAVRAHLGRVLEQNDAELLAWFQLPDPAPPAPADPSRPGLDANYRAWIIVIERVCTWVSNTITIYNEATKQWEKHVERAEKCKDVPVRVPNPEPPPPPGPIPTS